MYIEEESMNFQNYQIPLLEQQLLEAILDSLQNHSPSNATFLAERLICEHDIEEYRSLLAECFLRENKPYKVTHLLKDCKTEYTRYQLAFAYFRCGKIKEAERALIGNIPNLLKNQAPIPNGAYGHYLLGQIYEKQVRMQEAKENYSQALELNPTLWIAYERYVKIVGEQIQGNKIFTEQRHKKYELNRKSQNCNIVQIITNLIRNKQNTRLSGSAQKESMELDDHENKQDQLDQDKDIQFIIQKQKTQQSQQQQQQQQQSQQSVINNMNNSIKMTNSQIIVQQNLQQMDEVKDKNLIKTRNQQKNSHQINFSNYQNLFQQPLIFQQQGRIQSQRKSQGCMDMQKVGVSALQNQPAFMTSSNSVQISSQSNITQLLRIFSHPYQLWIQQSSDSISAFQKLSQNNYKSGWVLERVARCYMDQVKYAEAEKVWKELRELEPHRLEGMDYYSSCLWNLKKQTDLTYLAHQCLQISNLAPETWIALGNCFSLNKENENSLKYFNRAIQLKPDNAYAHTLSGHEYVQIEDFGKAKKYYEQAISLDPQQYNAQWGLGNILYKTEKYEEAIKYFKRAAQINPRNSVIFCFLGMAHAANNDHQEALKYYQQSEMIDPKNGMNRFEKANSLVKLEQFDAALNELKQLEIILPKEPQIFLLMGKIYKKMNRINESYKCFSLALSLENKDQQRIKGMIDALNNQDNEFNDDFDL